MSGLSQENIYLIKCDHPIRVEANEKWRRIWNPLWLGAGLFEQAPLHSCSRSVWIYLGAECVWVLWDIRRCCVCAVDEESVLSPAMMAPYLGHFSPSSGKLLTALALSTHRYTAMPLYYHLNGKNCNAGRQQALQKPVVRAACELLCINDCFSFHLCVFYGRWRSWRRKGEGQIN